MGVTTGRSESGPLEQSSNSHSYQVCWRHSRGLTVVIGMATSPGSMLAQPKHFWRAGILRGAGFWCALRLALPLLALSADLNIRDAVELEASVSLLLVAVATLLVQAHSYAMKERVFLGNMGIRRMAVVVPAGAAAVLELLTRVLVAAAVQ